MKFGKGDEPERKEVRSRLSAVATKAFAYGKACCLHIFYVTELPAPIYEETGFGRWGIFMRLTRSYGDILPFTFEALDSSSVGTWEYQEAVDRLRFDPFMAEIYRLTPAEGEQGIPLKRVAAVIHPDDRVVWRSLRGRASVSGGLFVHEYRITPTPGVVRWVLVRGRYGTNMAGQRGGRGIVIDVTDSKMDGYAEGHADFLSSAQSVEEGTFLDRAAAHAIAVRQALDEEDAVPDPALRAAADKLLMEMGRALNAKIGRERANDN